MTDLMAPLVTIKCTFTWVCWTGNNILSLWYPNYRSMIVWRNFPWATSIDKAQSSRHCRYSEGLSDLKSNWTQGLRVTFILICKINHWKFWKNVSRQFGCGILKMVGPKMQDFGPRINLLKGNPAMNYVGRKEPKSYFQSQFSMSKIDGIFSKNHLRISI